jgi:hypothetical protein
MLKPSLDSRGRLERSRNVMGHKPAFAFHGRDAAGFGTAEFQAHPGASMIAIRQEHGSRELERRLQCVNAGFIELALEAFDRFEGDAGGRRKALPAVFDMGSCCPALSACDHDHLLSRQYDSAVWPVNVGALPSFDRPRGCVRMPIQAISAW